MADHELERLRVPRFSLDLFGICCGIHEALVFYPDLRAPLDHVLHFGDIFPTVMAILFFVTVILWIGVGIMKAWGYLSNKPLRQSAVGGLKTFSEVDSFITEVELRKGDVDHAYQTFISRVHGVRLNLHDNEEAHESKEPFSVRFSPAEMRQAYEAVNPEEDALRRAVEELQNYLFA
jgi:hypothetical protein